MTKGKIIIEIDKKGQIEVEALGFKGRACHTKLQELQPILGKIIRSKKKAEFYQDEKVRVDVKAE